MIPDAWRTGEVAVLGLARTGRAATRWLRVNGVRVYASDSGPGQDGVADELASLGAAVESGGHDLARVARAAAVIASPGVPPDAAPLAAARAAGVTVLSEIELGARALPGTRLIVVTGTNGKSTTTALIAHLVDAAGVRCPAVGNIGRPLVAGAGGVRRGPDDGRGLGLGLGPRHVAPDRGLLLRLTPAARGGATMHGQPAFFCSARR